MLTVTLFLGILLIAVLCVGIGFFADRWEVMFLGAVLALLLGLWVLQAGISYDSGEVVSVVGDETIIEDTFTTTSSLWTNAFGLLLLLIPVGLLLVYTAHRKEVRDKKLRSVDLDDD